MSVANGIRAAKGTDMPRLSLLTSLQSWMLLFFIFFPVHSKTDFLITGVLAGVLFYHVMSHLNS